MSNGFWAEVMAKQHEQNQPQPLPRESLIPQTPPADDTIAGLVEQARAATVRPDPAVGVLSTPKTLTGGRQSLRPGADVGTESRRPGPAKSAEPSLLDLSPAERGALIALATRAGKFDENGTAKSARDNAAMVQAAIKDGAFDTTGDNQPPARRASTTKGVAGYTAGQHSGR